jgi:heme iron utilization protein
MTKSDLAQKPDNPAAHARRIMRQCLTTSLATVDKSGAPFASLVLAACDMNASPVLLMSTLASHTRNIDRDGRVSLLFDGTIALDVPMTGSRVTVSGKLERSDQDRHRQRFLRRHPDAALYADFGDFSFFSLQVDLAHLVAGFGQVNKIKSVDLLMSDPCTDELGLREADILDHMNTDHSSALDNMARHFGGSAQSGWLMTGMDAEGIDLRLGHEVVRVEFPEILPDIDQARAFLVNLAKTAA